MNIDVRLIALVAILVSIIMLVIGCTKRDDSPAPAPESTACTVPAEMIEREASLDKLVQDLHALIDSLAQDIKELTEARSHAPNEKAAEALEKNIVKKEALHEAAILQQAVALTELLDLRFEISNYECKETL